MVLVVGAVVAGLVLVAASSGTVRPVGVRPLRPSATRTVQPTSTPIQREAPGATPTWFDVLLEVGLLMLLVLFALAVPWMLFAGLRQHRDKAAATEAHRLRAEHLTNAVDTGLKQLDHGTPTDAVIASWVALERAAAAIDVARTPTETPAEFTARVLGVSGDPKTTPTPWPSSTAKPATRPTSRPKLPA